MERKEVGNENRCVTCGDVIPEGRQVCPTCESEYWRDWYDRYVKEHTCLSYSEMLVGKLQAELKKTKQDASKAVLQAFAKLKQQLNGVVIIRAVNDETKEVMDSDEVFGVIEKLEKEYRKGAVKMTYREQLEKVKELGINVGELLMADECDCVLDFEMSDKDFEDICEFAYYIYLKSEKLTANAIAQYINCLVVDKGKTIEDVINIDKWDFISEASYYMD